VYLRLFCVVCVASLFLVPVDGVRAANTTYYVSSSEGDDDNGGQSDLDPFETIGKVNALDLEPGDRVLFKCGDVWQAEQLIVDDSGTDVNPITFGSYPEDCANKPIFSGSLPITGWALDTPPNVYRADLPTGTFPLGINQLFRGGQRLTMGRWPNLDAGAGGYAFVEGHSAGSNQITDNALPSGVNWTGAIVHIKNIRWSMVDRQVTSSSGHTLTLNQGLSCLISGWTNCTGWGYFINNHRQTLDQDGEWYYDAGANRVYLYSVMGTPSDIEGSVVLEDATTLRHGGIMLSDGSATSYVIIDNIALENWFNHGIGTPGGMSGDIYHHITVRNVTIKDVDAAGVRLSSWLERPSNGRKGLRGGHHMAFTDNVIDGANHFGITGYFAQSTFEDNEIKNVALIGNLNKSGMGCGLTRDQCTENGDGFRIRTYDPLDSGYGNTLRTNRFDRTGYNAVDVFGYGTTLERNVIVQACYSKADCGGVRTFGSDNLSATDVHDLTIVGNIIVDIPGNVDGCHESRAAMGMGFYIDHYSRDVEVRGNTVISTTGTGILYQNSTGTARENVVYDASNGTAYAGHVSLAGDVTRVTLADNVLYALRSNAWTLYASGLGNFFSSDDNYLFHPYEVDQIAHGPSWTRYTFAEWKAYSGLESHSKTNWFTLNPGDSPLSHVFYNDTKTSQVVDLGTRKYLDLDQNDILGSITLPPFSSVVLVDNGEAGLILQRMAPVMWGVDEAADFTLTVYGSGFTENSVVRWDGVGKPTALINSYTLTATIYAADVSTVSDVPVTVYDPGGDPTETTPLTFHVVASVSRLYLPLVLR
jgi:hypothetical protein